ncbi:MAG: 30S ribosomal protein S9 [Acidobacteria bacterium]|nr:30S ribosomal protein S9 [Acidobacteriota bacterium]
MTEIHNYGTGRRKEAVARVFMRPGSGEMIVNGRALKDYFPNSVLRMLVRQPLQLTETTDKFDINVTVQGGGATGQAGAVRHGISRALLDFHGALRVRLTTAGLLTGVSRFKERM